MKAAAGLISALVLVGLAVAGRGGAQEGERRAVVWAVGDAATGTERSARLARRITRGRPDRFLYLGDVYERGTARDFRRRYHPIYGRLARITSPTPGNHEWQNRRRGYYPYWRRRHGKPLRPWYAFDLAGWEILSLNSEAAHGPDSSQVRWLRQRLARRDGTCRVAFWHRPRYGAGTTYGDSPDLAPLWRALRGHARLALAGHEHNLQRLSRRDGITSLIAGAGGARFYPLRSRDRRLRFGRTNRLGALRLVLEPGRALVQFRDSRGRVLDSGTASCRPLTDAAG